MEEELIKPVVRVGNSAGVVLPIEWYGGEAIIKLIRKPLNIKSDVLRIIEPFLDSVLGVYLVGSYSRREEDKNSDIDILVITEDINKKIIKGKYDILLISREEVKKAMKIVVPIIPMIREAAPIINKNLLNELKKEKIKKEHLKWHIDTTKSSLKIIKEILVLDGLKVNGNVIYQLILRLRQVYIVDCLLKNKDYSKKYFLQMLKKKGIYELYEVYKMEKNGKKSKAIEKSKAKIAYNLIEDYLNNL